MRALRMDEHKRNEKKVDVHADPGMKARRNEKVEWSSAVGRRMHKIENDAV